MLHQYKGWDSFSCFFSAEYSQLFLKKCYKLHNIHDIEKRSYQNCYPFIYFLEQGKLYFQQGVNSPLSIQPLLLFYGFVHLIKACLLTIDPAYPNSTSVLAHGVSTRKKKKQQYRFFQDEVKIQKNGLFTYMAEKMFDTKSLEGEKVKMEHLLKQIPELTGLFHIMNGQNLFLPVVFNNTTISVPVQILDTYFMNINRFKDYLEKKSHTPIKNFEQNKRFINIEYLEPLLSVEPFKYNISDNNHYISITKEEQFHFPEILSHYLILYNLSMISRYEIEWWSELLKTTPNHDYPFIENFLSISVNKGPYLIYKFLEKYL
ncbi:YaaC family protein [Niallia sp. 01092]|uniref:YaaC family protein n=1 Tax=unclassified Niallia TaxID=2837522 RepID=UPI003FD52C31